MIQVWCYDKDGFFIKSIFVEKVEKNMTEVALTIGYYKAKFDNDEWIEGATEEEIKEWQEKNKLKSKEPNETEILQKQLLETQSLVANLQEQILLKQNGGMK